MKSQTEQSAKMMKKVKISNKAQEANYLVAELIAKKRKPHTLAEELLSPACSEIVRLFFGEEAAKEVSKIPLSDNTIIADVLLTCLLTLKSKCAKRYKIYPCSRYKCMSRLT